jgi:hypothetical protein
MTDSETPAFLVLALGVAQTHLAVAVVSVTSLRLSLVVVVAARVGKRVHHVDKILKLRLA